VLKCRDMAELATAWLEGALPLRTRLAARLHLWLCEACRNYVDQLRRTMRFLSAIPPREPPDNENEIMTMVEALRRERGARRDGD
jgi:predicted anti-sigma-YlaC factor YlaD